MPIDDDVYLIWSNEHGKWWRAGQRGYTSKVSEAGCYSRHFALQACGHAIPGSSRSFNELPVRYADVLEFMGTHIIPAGLA